jgi:hypothetical protein
MVIQVSPGPSHQSIDIGAMPLINRFIERLRLPELIDKHVPIWDKRQKLKPAVCLLVLLRNILTSRLPLYEIPDWARAFDPALLAAWTAWGPGKVPERRQHRPMPGCAISVERRDPHNGGRRACCR